MNLEDTLRTARLEQKRSAEWVAAEVGVHANTIRYAENGRTSIGVEIFQRWAAVLGFDVKLTARESTAPIVQEIPNTPLPASAGASAGAGAMPQEATV